MKTEVTTHDIYFAAALLTLGCIVQSVDRSDPKHIKFTVVKTSPPEFHSVNLPRPANVTLDDVVGIEQYEQQWFNGKLEVNAVAFKHAFQHIQSILHSSL